MQRCAWIRPGSLAVAFAFALGACASTDPGATSIVATAGDGVAEQEDGRIRGMELAPWTEDFMGKAVLLANQIRIEGPTGLIQHVVVSADDALYERVVETTPDGFLQVTSRKTDDVPIIRCQIDNWQLAAIERIVVLERPDDCDVEIHATGEAVWRDPDGEAKREETLRFVGKIRE